MIFFEKWCNNTKTTWKGIKQIISIKPTDLLTPSKIILEDGSTVTDANEIANSFKNFFVNISISMSNQVTSTSTSQLSFLKSSPSSGFFLFPCTSNEIESLICGLSLKKAIGPYSIPTEILKKVGGIVAKPLELLCNLSFSNGVVPDNLKIARVVPLYKSFPRTCLSNYRPISLLSNFHKILEKLFYNRLIKFLDRSSTVFDSQFGSRAKHSTIHALLLTVDKIQSATEDVKFPKISKKLLNLSIMKYYLKNYIFMVSEVSHFNGLHLISLEENSMFHYQMLPQILSELQSW